MGVVIRIMEYSLECRVLISDAEINFGIEVIRITESLAGLIITCVSITFIKSYIQTL